MVFHKNLKKNCFFFVKRKDVLMNENVFQLNLHDLHVIIITVV